MDNPYKNSNLSSTTSLVKRGEPRNVLEFLPRVRAWDTFSVKHPIKSDRYLLVRRGQKLDEGHNGTTRVVMDNGKQQEKLEEPLNNSRNLTLGRRSQFLTQRI